MGFVTLRLEMMLSLSPANKTLKYRGRVKKINKYMQFRKDLFLPSFFTKWLENEVENTFKGQAPAVRAALRQSEPAAFQPRAAAATWCRLDGDSGTGTGAGRCAGEPAARWAGAEGAVRGR